MSVPQQLEMRKLLDDCREAEFYQPSRLAGASHRKNHQ
jgi:hypothetical protein